MGLTEYLWARAQRVGSPAERVVLMRLADGLHQGGDVPVPCTFSTLVARWDRDGMDAMDVIDACYCLQERGLLADVADDDEGRITGTVLCDMHYEWLAAVAAVGKPMSVAERRARSRHQRLHVLADRDGWACYLCHEPLVDVCTHDGTLPRELHAWLPQREHVVPRALGGVNDDSNLRLACWPCNARKGAQ